MGALVNTKDQLFCWISKRHVCSQGNMNRYSLYRGSELTRAVPASAQTSLNFEEYDDECSADDHHRQQPQPQAHLTKRALVKSKN
jgi:hypothetical protein